MTITTKRITLALALVLMSVVAAVAVFVLARSKASAATPNSTASTYQQSAGAEMTPEAVADSAVKFAREAGELGEVTVEVGRGTTAQARAVMELHSPAAAEVHSTAPVCFKDCSAAEVAQFKAMMADEQSGAYLVVMRGRKFSPSERLKRGQNGVTGPVMTLVVDSHTGIRKGLRIGGEVVPKVSDLGQVMTLIAPVQSNTAQVARGRARTRLGTLVGHLYVHHKLTSGWRVLVGLHRLTRLALVVKTRPKGAFELRIAPGQYVMAAVRSNGRLCGTREERVRELGVSHVVIDCA